MAEWHACIPDGFPGQRMIVLPRPLIKRAFSARATLARIGGEAHAALELDEIAQALHALHPPSSPPSWVSALTPLTSPLIPRRATPTECSPSTPICTTCSIRVRASRRARYSPAFQQRVSGLYNRYARGDGFRLIQVDTSHPDSDYLREQAILWFERHLTSARQGAEGTRARLLRAATGKSAIVYIAPDPEDTASTTALFSGPADGLDSVTRHQIAEVCQ